MFFFLVFFVICSRAFYQRHFSDGNDASGVLVHPEIKHFRVKKISMSTIFPFNVDNLLFVFRIGFTYFHCWPLKAIRLKKGQGKSVVPSID